MSCNVFVFFFTVSPSGKKGGFGSDDEDDDDLQDLSDMSDDERMEGGDSGLYHNTHVQKEALTN